MFIFDLVFGVIQLVALGGGGIFVYQDYKHGFVTSKAILAGASHKFRRLTGIKESETDKATETVEKWAVNIAKLREAVASVSANSQLAVKQSQEQRFLVSQFSQVEEEALRKNDEEAATVAAVAKIESERRSNLYAEHAQSQAEVAQVLERDLDISEMEFCKAQTKAETIRLNESIAEAQGNLYQLTSSFNVDGLTPKGELEQGVLRTEHKRLKSGVLLRLASKNDNSKIHRFMQDAEVKRELDSTRNRLALPPASTEASVTEEPRLISEAELVN